MPRLKITGYLEIEDSEADPTDSSGLTSAAYGYYFVESGQSMVGINDLEDVETELVSD